VETQKRDRVSRCRRSGPQLMVEDQAIGTDNVAKMKRGIIVGQEVREFTVVCGRNHDVGIGPPSIGHQFQEDRLSRGDAFHGVRAAKQFVQKKQMRRRANACLYEVQWDSAIACICRSRSTGCPHLARS
jgi:hypothetical protein